MFRESPSLPMLASAAAVGAHELARVYDDLARRRRLGTGVRRRAARRAFAYAGLHDRVRKGDATGSVPSRLALDLCRGSPLAGGGVASRFPAPPLGVMQAREALCPPCPTELLTSGTGALEACHNDLQACRERVKELEAKLKLKLASTSKAAERPNDDGLKACNEEVRRLKKELKKLKEKRSSKPDGGDWILKDTASKLQTRIDVLEAQVDVLERQKASKVAQSSQDDLQSRKGESVERSDKAKPTVQRNVTAATPEASKVDDGWKDEYIPLMEILVDSKNKRVLKNFTGLQKLKGRAPLGLRPPNADVPQEVADAFVDDFLSSVRAKLDEQLGGKCTFEQFEKEIGDMLEEKKKQLERERELGESVERSHKANPTVQSNVTSATPEASKVDDGCKDEYIPLMKILVTNKYMRKWKDLKQLKLSPKLGLKPSEVPQKVADAFVDEFVPSVRAELKEQHEGKCTLNQLKNKIRNMLKHKKEQPERERELERAKQSNSTGKQNKTVKRWLNSARMGRTSREQLIDMMKLNQVNDQDIQSVLNIFDERKKESTKDNSITIKDIGEYKRLKEQKKDIETALRRYEARNKTIVNLVKLRDDGYVTTDLAEILSEWKRSDMQFTNSEGEVQEAWKDIAEQGDTTLNRIWDVCITLHNTRAPEIFITIIKLLFKTMRSWTMDLSVGQLNKTEGGEKQRKPYIAYLAELYRGGTKDMKDACVRYNVEAMRDPQKCAAVWEKVYTMWRGPSIRGVGGEQIGGKSAWWQSKVVMIKEYVPKYYTSPGLCDSESGYTAVAFTKRRHVEPKADKIIVDKREYDQKEIKKQTWHAKAGTLSVAFVGSSSNGDEFELKGECKSTCRYGNPLNTKKYKNRRLFAFDEKKGECSEQIAELKGCEGSKSKEWTAKIFQQHGKVDKCRVKLKPTDNLNGPREFDSFIDGEAGTTGENYFKPIWEAVTKFGMPTE